MIKCNTLSFFVFFTPDVRSHYSRISTGQERITERNTQILNKILDCQDETLNFTEMHLTFLSNFRTINITCLTIFLSYVCELCMCMFYKTRGLHFMPSAGQGFDQTFQLDSKTRRVRPPAISHERFHFKRF